VDVRDRQPDAVDCGTGTDSVSRDTVEGRIARCETEEVGVLRLASQAIAAKAGAPTRVELGRRHPEGWRKLRAVTLRLTHDGVSVGEITITRAPAHPTHPEGRPRGRPARPPFRGPEPSPAPQPPWSTTMTHTIAHTDDLAREGAWLLARRTLDVRSFGINLVDVPPGGSLPAHDETESAQEEVYLVLGGRPTILIGDLEHEAGPGTFVRLDPEPVRSVVNRGTEPARLLMVSAPTSSGFAPMDWA